MNRKIVVVTYNGKLSTLAFSDYSKAVAWVLQRADKPLPVTGYCFKSDSGEYLLHDLEVE
jgi:hypothetical protein